MIVLIRIIYFSHEIGVIGIYITTETIQGILFIKKYLLEMLNYIITFYTNIVIYSSKNWKNIPLLIIIQTIHENNIGIKESKTKEQKN